MPSASMEHSHDMTREKHHPDCQCARCKPLERPCNCEHCREYRATRGFRAGDTVTAKKWTGEWVIEEIVLEENNAPKDAPICLRSLETEYPGPGYTRIWVKVEHLKLVKPSLIRVGTIVETVLGAAQGDWDEGVMSNDPTDTTVRRETDPGERGKIVYVERNHAGVEFSPSEVWVNPTAAELLDPAKYKLYPSDLR